jgi:glycosyltransferase involved in cell wall biosynthesis
MKISIITPCYNAEPYIARTIQSVQNQTITDWEMIIVDDGSNDNSADIIKDFASKDARIKLFQKENGGSASARNMGLALAQGEFIQFLDADDTIEPTKIERQITLMEQELLDVTYSDYCMVNEDGTHEDKKGHTFNLFKLLIGWGLFGTIPFHAFIYRHEFLRQNKILSSSEIREREDWDFHIKVFSATTRIQRLKGYCGAHYYRTPTGKTSCGSISKIKVGTIKYLIFKIKHIKGYKQLLLLLRLSTELIEVFLISLRKYMDIKLVRPLFFNQKENIKLFLLTLVLLPISLPIYVCRYIWAHTR